ncbi:LytR/AlgR family response regulator transcription factor [Clostridioides difficile]|uniref:Stage 0 sporulation protein A homolog n=3 Tax=Clostridioides difficile TaxID=1496 RepID=A0A9P3U0S3_CLODI|nr:LytTR family DNA-binding domain-containing protein [Clostridioides difficile]AWH76400.1 DNA-binding response regulator [Clostridioides difficile]AWH80176.1 DNA-binding response regulator [Clostridioides difficile]AXU45264.1 LytR family DNA-binding response regulator [Clostridioides difficile]AXU48968.1 LytR family DNA-binding response regulator [Clostridioides difficile]EGT2216519.1 response regulator [Clostridioides difficile]
MINIGICDDELHYRLKIKDILKKVLSSYTMDYNIHEFSSGKELLCNYPKNLDILIIDIQMEILNGIDTSRKIREFDENLEIIFMTSFPEFMQEGYEVKAYRYILKPINEKKITKNILPCIDEIMKKRNNYLTIKVKNYVDRIKIDSIIYIETDRPNIVIYTHDNTYTTKMSISKIEKILSEFGFFRCHNSYIINLKLVQSMNGNSVVINGKSIPVSKYRVKGLKLAITNILGDIIC